MRSEFEKINDKAHDEYEKINQEESEYMDSEAKKRTGMDYWTLFEKASEQNSLLDSGKLKWENSLWKVVNDIDDESYKKFDEQRRKSNEEAIRKETETGKKFAEQYFQTHDKMSYDDLRQYVKDTWNEEHEEWDEDWSIYRLTDSLCGQDGYETHWDDDTHEFYLTKKS